MLNCELFAIISVFIGQKNSLQLQILEFVLNLSPQTQNAAI